MIPGKREVSADNEAIAAAVHGYDAANPARCGQNRKGLDRRGGQIGGEEERPAARQQEAVARLQSHRVGDALDREPYLTGNDRVAFDAFMLAEADRQPSADVKAAGHVAARLEQRQHIRKRIHRQSRTIAKIIRTS